MPIEIVQDLNPAQWRNFVDSHPQGNIFHTPEMFQVFPEFKNILQAYERLLMRKGASWRSFRLSKSPSWMVCLQSSPLML
jgi:hypothetical protein